MIKNIRNRFRELQQRIVRKSLTSSSKFKIVAVALNYKDEIVGISTNGWDTNFDSSSSGHGKGKHAERELMSRDVKTIFLIRFGKGGKIRPIDPCNTCKSVQKKYNIKIVPLMEYVDFDEKLYQINKKNFFNK